MNRAPKRRDTPMYGGKRYSGTHKKTLVPPMRPPLDSTPTPVFELGYKDMNARLLLLASRFESRALELKSLLEILDIKLSKECRRAAEDVRALANRALELPNKTDSGLAAEKVYLAEQYSLFMTYAQEVMGPGRVL